MQTALVAGGAGFIGTHLCESLLKENLKVTCVDNLLTSDKTNISRFLDNPNFEFIEHDITLPFTQEIESVDFIYHLASPASPNKKSPRSYINFPIETLLAKSLGTKNLLELAREKKIKQFVFASSSSVYGVNKNVPWSERDFVLQPISPYAATKVACELAGHTYSHLYGIRFIGLRFF